MVEKIPALRIEQQGAGAEGERVVIYVTAMPLRVLREHAVVDTWNPDNEDGYQRPLESRRLREVANYVLEQQGILPMSVLVGTRPADEIVIVPTGFDETKTVSSGQLEIPPGAKLWVIDGQHRYYGVNEAFERTGNPDLAEYPFPVSLMWNIDQYAEMLHFNIVNTRQKKMSTDIVDRHLVRIQERSGLDMLRQGARGEKEYMRASATRLVDKINESEGPWFHQIAIPGVPGRDQGLVRQHAFVTSLEPVLKDSWVRGRTDEDKVQVITNFWKAAAQVWPDAFAEPKLHRVQATVGIYSLHMALPTLIQRCLERRDLTVEAFASLLKATGIDSEFWNKEVGVGDPLTLGTGMSSIRALALYISQRLPDAVDGAVKI